MSTFPYEETRKAFDAWFDKVMTALDSPPGSEERRTAMGVPNPLPILIRAARRTGDHIDLVRIRCAMDRLLGYLLHAPQRVYEESRGPTGRTHRSWTAPPELAALAEDFITAISVLNDCFSADLNDHIERLRDKRPTAEACLIEICEEILAALKEGAIDPFGGFDCIKDSVPSTAALCQQMGLNRCPLQEIAYCRVETPQRAARFEAAHPTEARPDGTLLIPTPPYPQLWKPLFQRDERRNIEQAWGYRVFDPPTAGAARPGREVFWGGTAHLTNDKQSHYDPIGPQSKKVAHILVTRALRRWIAWLKGSRQVIAAPQELIPNLIRFDDIDYVPPPGASAEKRTATAGTMKPKGRMKRAVAHPLIAQHLIKRPHDTAEEVAKAVGCSVGVVAESPAWKPAAKPNAKGYVARPTDRSAYVSAVGIVKKHTPTKIFITAKRLILILEDYSTNRVRWTRPLGKDGKPRSNRLNVHLSDWIAYIERRQKAGFGTGDDRWPTQSEDEIVERRDAIRRQKSTGK